jgi:hypothetical protein
MQATTIKDTDVSYMRAKGYTHFAVTSTQTEWFTSEEAMEIWLEGYRLIEDPDYKVYYTVAL